MYLMKKNVKKNILLFLFISLITISFNTNAQTRPIKIACVGNSITFGHKISNREKNAYPAQLQHLLGANYSVKNFGHSGRTLLKKGDYPYWKSDLYTKALQFKPDVVYIMLGTNDSKLQNRVHLDEFESDYT
ncbi:MAG: sialate O-acetylesterase, partial [Flavobacteriia bacterium]